MEDERNGLEPTGRAAPWLIFFARSQGGFAMTRCRAAEDEIENRYMIVIPVNLR
jgi:hypothetical protein